MSQPGRQYFVWLSAFMLVPASSASFDGSEAMPELVDSEQDVEYASTHTGPRDHDYIDVVSGWLDYDNRTNEVQLTFKIRDATSLETSLDQWHVNCLFQAEVTVAGEEQGTLRATWKKDAGAEATGGMAYRASDRDFDGSVPLNGTLRFVFDKPGYVLFSTPRQLIMQFGEVLENLKGSCAEAYAPLAGVPVPNSFNIDSAESRSAYSLVELRQTRTNDGSLEPWQRPAGSETPSEEAPPEQTGVPFWVGMIGVIVAAWAGILRRRQG